MFEDGVAAYERGDYPTALRLLRPLAEGGHAAAQLYLGTMCHFGDGVPQDFAEAVKWYRMVAEQDDTDAQYQLGSMYTFGPRLQRDFPKGAKEPKVLSVQGP